MSIVNTTEDGWDCVPELTEVVDKIDECASYVYEIKNCVRTQSLDNMVSEMKEHLQDAIDRLDEIDISNEYETVEDED